MHNGRDLVGDCLRSIPAGVDVVAVDDASTDGVADEIESTFPHVRLIRNERNLGFGATANRGLAASCGAVRLVLNSDARLRPGALEAITAAFEADGAVGIVGPRLVFPDGSHQSSAASFPTVGGILAGAFLLNDLYRKLRPNTPFRWQMALAAAEHDEDRDVDWVMGTAIALREQCFESTGGFDPGYFMYVEETDLCWRAHADGWRVRYIAGAVVEHLGGGSTGDPTLHARRYLVSERRFFQRAYGVDSLRAWRRARLAGSAAKVLLLAPPALASRRVRQRLRWHLAALRHLLQPDPSPPGRRAAAGDG